MEQERTITAVRPIAVITAEIWLYRNQAASAMLEIGRRLIEAKEQLGHGEWLPWLEHEVQFSEATAQRFMRLAREYPNPSPVTDLGTSKALALLALPPEEREEFAAATHIVNGEEKTAADMSKRELEQTIRERDKAKADAERARAEAAAAEEARNTAQTNMKAAENLAAAAREEADALRSELTELRNAPVVVEMIQDQAAIDFSAARARQQTEEELKGKISQAERDKLAAEDAEAKAREELADLKVSQERERAAKEKELQGLEGQIRTLQTRLKNGGSSDVANFRVYFGVAQNAINAMADAVDRMTQAGTPEAEKLRAALVAMLTKTLELLGEEPLELGDEECGEA